MPNLVVGLILLGIVIAAVAKIVAEKKQGAKCIGCPHGKSCGKDGGCDHHML